MQQTPRAKEFQTRENSCMKDVTWLEVKDAGRTHLHAFSLPWNSQTSLRAKRIS
jgi:hypothetical protein